jgi:hypothetical protein
VTDEPQILQHYRNLLALRTDPEGKPKKGYGDNVKLLRRLISEAEGQANVAESATQGE